MVLCFVGARQRTVSRDIRVADDRAAYPHPPQCAHWGTFPQGKVLRAADSRPYERKGRQYDMMERRGENDTDSG